MIGAQVRRVIVGSVSVGVVFTLWVVLSKVSRAVGHLPWQDDPFDILTSFDFILPPVLVAAIASRSLLLASPLRIGPDTNYLRDVLPGVALFGLGLATMVAPLTGTALAAAPAERAGVASGVNNAVARTGALLAIAALPTLGGLTGNAYLDPAALADGYRTCALLCAALLAAGGVLAWTLVPGTRRTPSTRPRR